MSQLNRPRNQRLIEDAGRQSIKQRVIQVNDNVDESTSLFPLTGPLLDSANSRVISELAGSGFAVGYSKNIVVFCRWPIQISQIPTFR